MKKEWKTYCNYNCKIIRMTISKIPKSKDYHKKTHKSKFQKYFKTYVKMSQIKKFRKQTIMRNKKY